MPIPKEANLFPLENVILEAHYNQDITTSDLQGIIGAQLLKAYLLGREDEANSGRDYEYVTDEDLTALSNQIGEGYTSGLLQNEGYNISWQIKVTKIIN